MKKISLLFVLILGGCGRLESLEAIPKVTPTDFLLSQPYLNIKLFSNELILIQPSSTFLVYLLGVITILLGLRFLKDKSYASRKWWGISMIFWGLGAIAAGTSYQGFGYELKCSGYEYCTFTSWWEIIYLYLTAISINSLAIAIAYSCTKGRLRKFMFVFSLASALIYLVVLIVGSVVPIRFLVSYELFMLFFMPNFILFFILNVKQYRKRKDEMNKYLIITWLLFLAVNISYFVYLLLGVTTPLYNSTGVWFSENDVLHVTLIFWMIFIWSVVRKKIHDYETFEEDA